MNFLNTIGRGLGAIRHGATAALDYAALGGLPLNTLYPQGVPGEVRSNLRRNFLSNMGMALSANQPAMGPAMHRESAAGYLQNLAAQQQQRDFASRFGATDLSPDALKKMGAYYLQRGDLVKAKEALDMAQSMAPKQAETVGEPFLGNDGQYYVRTKDGGVVLMPVRPKALPTGAPISGMVNGAPGMVQRDTEGNLSRINGVAPMPNAQVLNTGGAQQVVDLNQSVGQRYSTAPFTSDYENYLLTVPPGQQATPEGYAKWRDTEANLRRPTTTVNVNGPQQTFANEGKMRDDFRAEPAVKAFQEISLQNARAQAAFAQAQKALFSGDSLNSAQQVLVTVLNKVLDPNSVVRESEYARTADGQSALGRLEGVWTRLKQGGAGISASEMQDVMRTISNLNAAAFASYQQVADQYRGLAKDYQLDPSHVVPKANPSGVLTYDPATGRVR
jgi:hypothetical protein